MNTIEYYQIIFVKSNNRPNTMEYSVYYSIIYVKSNQTIYVNIIRSIIRFTSNNRPNNDDYSYSILFVCIFFTNIRIRILF